ncbi:MAG: MerR family DNA-binding transcriptional regulator, partial [Patescibacteria group bacterium]
MNNFLTIQQAANLLGVSTKTLRRWEAKGILVPQRTPGNQRRYTQSQIDRFKGGEDSSSDQSANTLPDVSQNSAAKTQVNSRDVSEFEKSSSDDNNYWAQEFVKSVSVFKKLALGAGIAMILIVIAALAFATLKSGFDKDSLVKVLSMAGIGGDKSQKEEYSDIPRDVLGADTEANSLMFGVNIPSKFAKSAQFLDTIRVARIATLAGGIITENANIDAGTGELTASNVLYGVIAGDGIEISTGQTPTITNTGVLSIGGETGEIALKAGTGISISGLTISNTSTVTTPNGFASVVVGSDTISAGTADILTIAAGTGLSVLANTSTKTVTISPNGLTVGTAACITSANGIVTGSAACPVGSTDSPFQALGGTIIENNTTLDLLIGGITTLSAKFAVLNMAGGTPTASIAANSGNNAAFLTGAGTLATTNKQTLTLGSASTGDIALFGFGAGIIRSNASGVLSSSPLNLSGGATEISGYLPFANGGSPFFQDNSLGAIYPLNSTTDFLIGGATTASAKFAVLNMAGGTPTASLSAGTANNAVYLTGDGILATTNKQTLTLGSASTGNIVLNGFTGNNAV